MPNESESDAERATRVPQERGEPGPARRLVLGHRGSPTEAVENTLSSFAAAVSAGADGVELDVRRSRDGHPVVIHDDTLHRTMKVRGRISRLDWSAIERLTGARVPSLEQAVAWAAAAGAWLNIELKSEGLEEYVVRLVSGAGLSERTIVSSFLPGPVGKLGEIDVSIRRYFLAERWNEETQRAIDLAKAEGLCLRVDAATPETVERIAMVGLPLIVWTVNDPSAMRALLAANVVAIITDDPATAVRVRAELTSS